MSRNSRLPPRIEIPNGARVIVQNRLMHCRKGHEWTEPAEAPLNDPMLPQLQKGLRCCPFCLIDLMTQFCAPAEQGPLPTWVFLECSFAGTYIMNMQEEVSDG